MTTPIPAEPAWLQRLETQSAREFAAYWLSRRGGLFMPRRRDIDPSEIRNLLPSICVIEVVSPEAAVFRLAGTAHRETMGFEPTGRNIVDLVETEHRPIRAWRFWQSATQPCGQKAVIKARFGSGDRGRDRVPAAAGACRRSAAATAAVRHHRIAERTAMAEQQQRRTDRRTDALQLPRSGRRHSRLRRARPFARRGGITRGGQSGTQC
ncbi:MAG: PAS domain-containing protein [Aliidongia sp.]